MAADIQDDGRKDQNHSRHDRLSFIFRGYIHKIETKHCPNLR